MITPFTPPTDPNPPAPNAETLPDPRPIDIVLIVGADKRWRYLVEGMVIDATQLDAWLRSQMATGRYDEHSQVIVHNPAGVALGLGHASTELGSMLAI